MKKLYIFFALAGLLAIQQTHTMLRRGLYQAGEAAAPTVSNVLGKTTPTLVRSGALGRTNPLLGGRGFASSTRLGRPTQTSSFWRPQMPQALRGYQQSLSNQMNQLAQAVRTNPYLRRAALAGLGLGGGIAGYNMLGQPVLAEEDIPLMMEASPFSLLEDTMKYTRSYSPDERRKILLRNYNYKPNVSYRSDFHSKRDILLDALNAYLKGEVKPNEMETLLKGFSRDALKAYSTRSDYLQQYMLRTGVITVDQMTQYWNEILESPMELTVDLIAKHIAENPAENQKVLADRIRQLFDFYEDVDERIGLDRYLHSRLVNFPQKSHPYENQALEKLQKIIQPQLTQKEALEAKEREYREALRKEYFKEQEEKEKERRKKQSWYEWTREELGY